MAQTKIHTAAPNLPDDRNQSAHAVRDSSKGETSMATQALARRDEHLDAHAQELAGPSGDFLRPMVTAWARTRSRREIAWDRHSKAEKASMETSPAYPEAARAVDQVRSLEFAAARQAGKTAATEVAQRPRHPSYDIWRVESDRIAAEYGVEDLEQAARALADETRRLRDRIIAQPVASVRDLAAKVAVIAAHTKEEDLDEEEVVAAVLQIHKDLQALTSAMANRFEG